MITILKTQDFAVSDLTEYILEEMPANLTTNWALKPLIHARIKLWLIHNAVIVEEKKSKAKPKKTGRRKQLEMKL